MRLADKRRSTCLQQLGGSGCAASPLAVLAIGLILFGHAQGDAAPASQPSPYRFDILAFGAVGDGQTKDTAAIQRAIDRCAENGGGTVLLPPGKYLSGSLHLRSHVTLYLDAGAILSASPDAADFDPYEKLAYKTASDDETTYFHHSLIWGEDVNHVAILGQGTIDGNRDKRGGPKLIAMKRCRFITLRDVTLTNCPNYNVSLLGCDYVGIDGVMILNGFADGIDPDCCRHVRISNCHVECWDDAIVLKSSFALGERRATENVAVTNCVLSTSCSAFKTGTESGGGFKYITVSNLVIFSPPRDRPRAKPTSAGIELDTVDGGVVEGVTIANVSMTGVRAPIFLRLGNRGRDLQTPVPGVLRNVTISNVEATGALLASSITGLEARPIESVTLSNVRVTHRGGGRQELASKPVPEHAEKYPASGMFGELPAYGLYCRHVRDLRLRDVELTYQERDDRPALVCEDVEGFQLNGFSGASAGATPLLWLRDARRVLISQCLAPSGTGVFLRLSGLRTAHVQILANDLSEAAKAFETDADTPTEALFEAANHLSSK